MKRLCSDLAWHSLRYRFSDALQKKGVTLWVHEATDRVFLTPTTEAIAESSIIEVEGQRYSRRKPDISLRVVFI